MLPVQAVDVILSNTSADRFRQIECYGLSPRMESVAYRIGRWDARQSAGLMCAAGVLRAVRACASGWSGGLCALEEQVLVVIPSV